ncbi:hypothetical protein KUTeg_023278 [Tegillarca granosa]|uniref:Liprin-alpha CC2 domain-containing protein n=1 Tax=Tegillarca granosa TaxID=220873 RepID=A0ABQ9E7C8_TEGGR|nr:hypothetical protein KUTeg_023278 [Tegillarca granosa]
MMCDVMPTISEDGSNDRESQGSGDDANFEQLMVNMLDERDKLMETLRETQDALSLTQAKLRDIEKDKEALQAQLQSTAPQQEFASISKEVAVLREHLLEKDEEVSELKAERNNTRLLLEHLECLVSRHERSLRMTVVKRQASSPAGVSSEVEVLKALKSLFEHHKALDEKVRERLRVALERVAALEEELATANQELFTLREQQSKSRHSSGSTEESSKSSKLEVIQQESDHVKIEPFPKSIAQKEDQEERIATLEKRYLNAQRESTSLHDLNDKLESELANKESQLKSLEEKCRSFQEKFELAEQRLQQSLKKAEALPTVEAELAQRMEALNQAEERHGSTAERLQTLEQSLSEKESELQRSRQREKMNEDHNQRLSSTVDRLLTESNERLQLHLKERMQALEEKNQLTQELERVLKTLDDTQQDKERVNDDLARAKKEVDTLRQQIEHLARPGSGYVVNPSLLLHSPEVGMDVARRAQRGREQAMDEDPTKEWEKMQQAHVLANVQQAFDASDTEGTDDNESVMGAFDMLSPSGHTDAQTLALMLQEQLDAINNEIRLIQEEKESTEQRAEELESRVGSGSLDAIAGRWHTSPPLSGRSSPTQTRVQTRDYLQKYHTAPAGMSTSHLYTYSSSSPQLATAAVDHTVTQVIVRH